MDYTIEKIDLKNNSMDVVFTITNSTSIDFKENEWSIHWNQIDGEPLAESLPRGIHFERVNGTYYILKFTDTWSLQSGESISFRVATNGIMSRLPLGPRGGFIVTSSESINLNTNINWQDAKGLEDLILPTAKKRYQKLENVNSISKDSLSWIVPSPTYSTKPTTERLRLANWNVYFAEENTMNKFDVLLKVRFQEIISTLFPDVVLQWVESVEEANFILKLSSDLTPEGYNLEIKQDHVVVTTNSYGGLFYALQSLLQIDQIAVLENRGWPIINIDDEPRFTYRGFMLDISRNFYGLPKLKQIIDLMAMFKLNHFDIKLSDDEGWRLEIPGLPELTEIGSKRGYTKDESDRLIPMYGSGATGGETGNGFLSKNDFISLLQYGKSKNITIIPQLSFPSHARASIISMDARRNKLLAMGDVVGAEKYALSDPNDKSKYLSPQLYNDNAINICMESSFAFFEKVVAEVAAMYIEADVSFKQFGIGADELPYGVWEGSPVCLNSVNGNSGNLDLEILYNNALLRLKETIESHGAIMSGWEDFLLVHSKNSHGETKLKKERFNYEVIPYTWNNTWGGGREDMIYKLANAGFKTVMSNSSAFYFDMANDNDMDAFGLSWSGYVDYFDTWAIDPQDIFANSVLNQKHNIQSDYISKTTKLKPSKRDNLIGIQSQLWTETVTNDRILEQMLVPNLIVFAERAWAKQPDWILNASPTQKQKMLKDWNYFLNVLGKRTLPVLHHRFPEIVYDLPKPGGVIENDTLYVRSQFPGLQVRYSLDGSVPNQTSKLYQYPILIDSDDVVVLRSFDTQLNGGKSIRVSQE
ncbi:MAG: family 20 glycosylhydrolase [Flavobacteriaceae bacterium]